MPKTECGYNIIIAARTKMARADFKSVLSAMKYCIEKSDIK